MKRKLLIFTAVFCFLLVFASNVSADSLVAHWEFDEGSGSSASDSSSNSNTGTLYNMDNEDWIDGLLYLDTALDFDGSNDYIEVSDHSSMSFGSGAFTIAFWIKQPVNNNGTILINGSIGSPYSGKRYEVVSTNAYGGTTEGALVFVIDDNSNKDSINSGITYVSDDWMHCVCVRNTSADKLYIYRNGCRVGSIDDDTGNIDSSGESLYIAQNDSGADRFDGMLDDIRLYDYALSESAIETLYTGTYNYAYKPSPIDEGSADAGTVVLGWTAGNGADSHDVYFGVDSTPDSSEFKGNQSGVSYSAGSLSEGVTYYWRIDEIIDSETHTGNVWSFTTTRDLYSDTWVAVDDLGRALSDNSECGSPRANRYAVMFYHIWHGSHGTEGPYDATKLIEANPSNPAWGDIGDNHHWAESEFGYYLSTDEYVIRKHAQFLADAGVDAVVFDLSNQATYTDNYMLLCDVYMDIRSKGGTTPQIIFLCPFGAPLADPDLVVNSVYNHLYSPGRYSELWFEWDGKPLILANADFVSEQVQKDYFTFRRPMPYGIDGPNDSDQWGWMEMYPQHEFYDSSSNTEEMTVSAAQSIYKSGSSYYTSQMSDERGAMGRSWHNGSKDTGTGAVNYGYNFQEQWDHALDKDPEFVFLASWNEWAASRYDEEVGGAYPSYYTDCVFWDSYDQEYSKDIEPMKGGHGDNYYYQLVDNVRRFKGVRQRQAPTAAKTITIDGSFSDWADVGPEYRDWIGDTTERDHDGWGSAGPYTNSTGRNDFVTAKVARDDTYIYFYIETDENITSYTGSKWMLLFINSDQNYGDGWEGYDYLVNLSVNSSSSTTLKGTSGGWNWTNVDSSVPYSVSGNKMELRIERSDIGQGSGDDPVSFDFHWADNIQSNDDITEFAINGDSAPDRRFNYCYDNETKMLVISDISPSAYDVSYDDLDEGELVYTDRSYTFSGVPAAYEQQTYIKTENDDKTSTGSSFLTFEINMASTVYVAHDDRITTKPDWMNSFTDTGDALTTGSDDFSLYAKDFAAGTVTLGGNYGTGSHSMYNVVVIPKEPAAYWRLDETSGTSAADSSNNGNTGTLNNMNDSDWVSGKYGNALDFDGSNDYISVSDDSSMDFGTGSFSISLWVIATNYNNQSMMIINGTSGGGYSGKRYSLRYDDDDVKFAIDDNSTKTEFGTSSDFLSGGAWHHVVAVRDRADDELRIYVDGSESASTTDNTNNSIDSASEPVYIGRDGIDYNGNYVDGRMDEICMFDYALSQSEITDLYNGIMPTPPPAQADGPTPADEATSVSVTTDLSWTAGTGTYTHDVYFGEDSTPDSGEFKGNQAGTTYNTGTMTGSTTYYWRIDEVNAGGTTVGIVWSFTTEAAGPGKATSPSPANSAANVAITADLSWTAGSGATSHDVYFGQSSPGSFQGNQGGTTYNTGTMSNDTTYYWRIDEVNAGGTTTGTVWSFTTTSTSGIYDVTDYGATGDGSTSDTDAINDTIAAADANSGGTVYFPTGTYKTGSIVMKDNITLELSENATLLATDANEYSSVDDNPWDNYQDWGHSHWKSSLIWGIGVNNVAITGTGLINGDAMTTGDPCDGYGDRVISFKDCNGILIEDIDIYRGGHFCIITSGCNDITIDNVLMDTNRDGINIDCCNDVNIINCTVNSPKDDAICMKSSYCLGYKRPTENVNISNCTVMGHAVGYLLNPPGSDEGWHAGRIKFGTESNGGFKNITITDCNFEYCYGFMLATVDGGDIDNITIDNIQMDDLWCPPIFMRLGNRARGPGLPGPGTYRNVTISNITGSFNTSFSGNASSIISGIPGHYIEDVNFSNIDIVYPGGGLAAWADIEPNENENHFPDVFMFGTITPSYGFYVRHAKGIELHDCDFSFDPNNDERPAFVLVDVNGFELDNVDAERYYTSGDHIKFDDDIDNLDIHDSPDFPSVTASYSSLQASSNPVEAGECFTITAPSISSANGVCTTNLLVDSNAYDTEYIWLNSGVSKDLEFEVQLYEQGDYLLEVDTQDINVTVSTAENLVISNLSPSSYEVSYDDLDEGEFEYVDRSYTFSDVPDSYEQETYIKTKNDDKYSTGNTFLTFTINLDSTVYVAHDDLITTEPNWLNSFTDTGDDINSDGDGFSLHYKDFETGTVVLGGNYGSGSHSMYFVVVIPLAATSPTPAHSANNVAINTDLSWTAGNGATSHDVYFGEDATPDSGEFKGNQAPATYDTGTMTGSTTYYWRIDEVSGSGTTTGSVWSFTTGSPPSQATSPTPANSATDVTVDTDLSWTAGSGAASHDVYFGEDATPDSGEFKGNQGGTTYDTGTMSNSTTYYWRIDEVNTHGTTTGTVWSFTTGSAPSQATSPTPANSASNLDVDVNLSWTAGSGASSHDVYFGQDSTPDSGEFKGNQGGTSYDPGTMNPNTTYYWRIDEVNTYGTTTGTVWSFTTETVDYDARWKFNESSGSTASDSSGNGNDGTLNNMNDSDWVSGQWGNALDFDGSNDYVSVSDDSAMDFGTGSFSISLWVIATNYNNSSMMIINGTSGGGYSGKRYSFRYDDDDVIFVVDDDSNKTRAESTTNFLHGGAWHHVVAVRDRGSDKLRIYVDGSLISEVTDNTNNSIDSPSEPVYIGRDGIDNSGNYVDGRLDDIRLYDFVLSSDDVDDIYDGTK